jgi:hypothetical protein
MMRFLSCAVVVLAALAACACPAARADLRDDFAEPPLRYKTRPLWFWNGPLSKAAIEDQMRQCRDRSGYYGFGILPSQGMTPAYTSAEFLDRYGDALDQAAALGMKMCLYDEYWFPSGNAGGELARKYPDHTAKRLDLVEESVTGPAAFQKALPAGTLMAVVAMKTDTKERIDLTGQVQGGQVVWNVPAGTWNLMIFVCVRDGWDHVDYLSPESVGRFIELTYQRFFDRFSKHFGTTIDSAFYDEPTFWTVQGGRMWTEQFNAKFRARHGYDPAPYYPALWHDIGPQTEAARAALFGFRAELFSTGFVKTIDQWCREHKIQLTGHVDQEEIVNPTGLCGDLMKAFEHQDIPGIDQIFQYGRASKAYKLVSSAACNYDRPLVMTETYGAIKDMPVANLYKEAMDQYAKGINLMVPHAVWYEPKKIVFPPELSYRDPVYGPALPEYNRYMGRLNLLLQSGRHVADIAVIYPIATLQAGYHFGPGNPYLGGPIPEEADYMDVGDLLALSVRRDFTFLHPDVLRDRCSVRESTLSLENKLNPESYRVVVLPGSKTVALDTIEKLKRFCEQGGKVIATTRLPHKSAEFGKDAEVQAAVRAIFGMDALAAAPGSKSHPHGGKAYFVSRPTAENLRQALDDALPVYDVEIQAPERLPGGNLSYLHKVRDGRDLYFLANSSDAPVEATVVLRGKKTLEWWDPHTGRIAPAQSVHAVEHGEAVTRLVVKLGPVRSMFLLGVPGT